MSSTLNAKTLPENTEDYPEFFEKVVDAMTPEDRDKLKLWLMNRMTEFTRETAIDHWKWLGAKTPDETRCALNELGLDLKTLREFNKCLDQIDKKCLCGQREGVITICRIRKGVMRCERCKIGGDFFPWDEQDLKLIQRLDLGECYNLDF